MPGTVLWYSLSQLIAATLHILRKSRNKHEGSHLLHCRCGVMHLVQQAPALGQHLLSGLQHLIIECIQLRLG